MEPAPFDQEFEDSINRSHQYEDWNRLTDPNRSNHYLSEVLIHGQAERVVQELSCDNEYVEEKPSRKEVQEFVKSLKRRKKR